MGWRGDLAFLADEISQRHPNPFARVSEATFRRALADLDAAIPQLTDEDLKVRVAGLVALLGDAHTGLDLAGPSAGFHRYPLALTRFADGLFVVGAPEERAELVGARVIDIGGDDVDSLASRASELISHDTDQYLASAVARYLVVAEVLRALGAAPNPAQTHFLLEVPGGSRRDVVLAPDALASTSPSLLTTRSPSDPVPLFRKQPRLDYWWEYVARDKAAYLQFNRSRDPSGDSFAKLSGEVLAFADANPVERLIIDLRNNVGGSSEIIQPLVAGLRDRPWLQGRGHLAVITGPATCSSAVADAFQLKYQLGGVIFGEATGGRLNGYGEPSILLLPYSRLTVTYATQYLRPSPVEVGSLMPDVPVTSTSTDYLSGRDPVFSAIIYGKN